MEEQARATVIYEADPRTVQSVHALRQHMHQIANKHTNRHVRVQTIDGQTFEGVIMSVDNGLLYLLIAQSPPVDQQRSYYYNNVILPLVLYELLVITLML